MVPITVLRMVPIQRYRQENDESWGKAFYFWGEENKKYATGTYEGRWDNICGEDYIKSQFQKLKEKFTDQGVPVIIGEFAAVRRTLSDQQAQEGHDLSRAAFDKCVVREANARGLVPFYWCIFRRIPVQHFR